MSAASNAKRQNILINELLPVLTMNRPVIIHMTTSNIFGTAFYIVLLGYDGTNVYYASSRDGVFKSSTTLSNFTSTYFYQPGTSSEASWDGEYLYFYNPNRTTEYNGTTLPGYYGRIPDPNNSPNCTISPVGPLLTFALDGYTRFYALHVPASYGTNKGQTALPLVVDFHGFGQNSSVQSCISGLKALSETQNFIVAYPEANLLFGTTWNMDCGNSGSMTGPNCVSNNSPDDVKFAVKVVDDVKRQLNIDPSRVYLTGISMGASMALKCAVQRRDVFAAVGAVSSYLEAPIVNQSYSGSYTVDTCAHNPKICRYIPVLQMNSYDDDVVPYGGNPTIEQTVAAWRNSNNCNGYNGVYLNPSVPNPCVVCKDGINVCSDTSPEREVSETASGCSALVKRYALHSSPDTSGGCGFPNYDRHNVYDFNWHGTVHASKEAYISGEEWNFFTQSSCPSCNGTGLQ